MCVTKTYTEREAVRLVGLRMLVSGRAARDVMEACHVCDDTVREWRRRLENAGGDPDAAADDAPRCGAPPKLDEAQRDELIELLVAGPEAAGFEGNLWTLPRIRRLILDRFGVEYHVDHLGRLVKALGYSSKKPILRALQRNDEARRKFREETWPAAVKKGAPRMPSSSASTRRAS